MRGDGGPAQHDLLDLTREDVDAPQDDHVVAAAGDLPDAAERGPRGARQQPRQVAGAVADDGQRLLGERGQHQLALLGGLLAERVHDLRVDVVLPHVEPVLGLHALLGHTRAHHFRQPVDVDRVQVEPVLDLAAHLLRPRLGAEDAHAQRGRARVDALALELVKEREHVGRGDHDDLGPEVLDDPHLPGGHAARGGDHGAAGALGTVVRAQPSGEQPVSVGDMHLVPRPAARRAYAARDQVGPVVQVTLGVADDRRTTRRAAGGVDAADAVHRHAEHPERVGLTQVGLGRERKARQVLQRAAVLGPHPGRVELAAVQLDVVVRVPQRGPQVRELVGAQLLGAHPLTVVEEPVRRRLPSPPVRRHTVRRRAVARHAVAPSGPVTPVRLRLRPRNSAITCSPRSTLTS